MRMEANRVDDSRSESFPTGMPLLHDPTLNKGTAFSDRERDTLGLRGLLPPRVIAEAEQVRRVLENLRRKTSDIEKYIDLMALLDRNETLFYRTVLSNIEETMPIVYTPTVGEACKRYAHIFQRPRGMFLSIHDRGRIAEILGNWPVHDVKIIVVTDGERILGLGDLGANGMGIPVGKLALYTACAGVHPKHCLPITLDVGTNNEELLADPLYIGLPERRVTGADYDALLDEFVAAVQRVFPGCLLQFEDFANHNAFRLLERYRDRLCTFNDDIQGTAAVALAGLLSAGRVTGMPLTAQRIVFVGAGEAAVGTADLTVAAMMREGMGEAEAKARVWLVDSKGLVVAERGGLNAHKQRYAHVHPPLATLDEIVATLRPTALIGASGQPQVFTQRLIMAMAAINTRPIIFALSNPTSKAECTAEQAYHWSDGRAIFVSGSPFLPVKHGGKTFVPGQGNNAYIFPGVGLGVIASGAQRVTDEMFYIAAQTLAKHVSKDDLAIGCMYPPLPEIRSVSVEIAVAIANFAIVQGLATIAKPMDMHAHVRSFVYEPVYRDYV
jgi:malate dehydrogenase (oxaloacetate-decarboxylating)(NADP+)